MMGIKDKKYEINETNRNFNKQYYRGLPLRQVNRAYGPAKARRYVINDTNQNVWIPCKHLHPDGTIKEGEDIDYVFVNKERQLSLAGYKLCFKEIDY